MSSFTRTVKISLSDGFSDDLSSDDNLSAILLCPVEPPIVDIEDNNAKEEEDLEVEEEHI
jgi:hypothetical protein